MEASASQYTRRGSLPQVRHGVSANTRRPLRRMPVAASVTWHAEPTGFAASRLSAPDVTVSSVDVTEADVAATPARNIRVPMEEFTAVWRAASHRDHHDSARGGEGWYAAGVAATCRWLATAPSRLANGLADSTPAPATRRRSLAYEEVIEAEFLAAERLEQTHPHLARSRPGWCEGIRATLRWAWRRDGPRPLDIEIPLER